MTHAYVAAAFALSLSAVVASSVTAPLNNPSLEEGCTGWHLPKPNFSVVDGAGRNGTKGLVCEGKDTNTYQIAHLELPFKTGQRFKVSLWARNESLSKGEPGMCVEYFGEGNRYFGGAGMKLDAYQPKDPREWRRYVALVGPVNPEVKHCRLRVYIGRGVAGRCVFDDVELEILGTEPRGLLFTDRSDDRASDGDVRFIAKSHADILRMDEKDVEGFFTFEKANGATERVDPDFFKDGRAEVVVKVDRLAPGPHQVVFTVKDKKSGHVLDDMRMCFTRLSAPETAVSGFDRKRRMLVDGRPSYPLAIYMGDWCRDDPRFLPAIMRSPIRTIVYYTQKPNRADLDFFHSHGIRVVESLIYFWAGDYNYCRESSAPDEEIALTIRTVNELKDHPALLGWYLFDEPKDDRFPRIRERYKVVRALDSAHFCLTVINHAMVAHDAAATCDVLGLDCYPVPGSGTEKTNPADLGRVASQIIEARDSLRGGKPLWIVPQAFASGGRRFPTRHELRSMTWQAIAGGADGVLFYSMDQMLNKRIAGWFPFDESWDIVCRVAQEVKDHERFLLSDETPPAVGGLKKGLVARAWRKEGIVLVAACNTTLGKIDTTLGVCGRPVPVSLARHDVSLVVIDLQDSRQRNH